MTSKKSKETISIRYPKVSLTFDVKLILFSGRWAVIYSELIIVYSIFIDMLNKKEMTKLNPTKLYAASSFSIISKISDCTGGS